MGPLRSDPAFVSVRLEDITHHRLETREPSGLALGDGVLHRQPQRLGASWVDTSV